MKNIRIYRLFLCVFMVFAGGFAFSQTTGDVKAIYNALALGKPAQVDAQLSKLSSLSTNDRSAFEGALLMRKAGSVTLPSKKLELFKTGNKKLEAAISKEPSNADYRFLRLMIQENAPKALGYHKQIGADSKFIIQNFKSLSAAGQQAAKEYSRRSASLRL